MISRRNFIAQAAVWPCLWSELLAASPVRIGCQTNAWRINPVNFQDLLGVLAKLKELGFDGFETSFRNVQGQFANGASARKILEATGLALFGVHIYLEKYDERTQVAPIEEVKRIVDGAAVLGAQRLILSGGGLISEGRVDRDAVKRKADGLNEAGKYCRSKGIRLAYHNHGPEMANEGLEIGQLLRLTDPATVDFLMDCGWAFRAGLDVPAFFRRHHRRLVGVHLRDFNGDEQVPLGQGQFPIAEMGRAIAAVKWKGWVINEEERLSGAKPGETAVGPARQTLRRIFGR